LVSPNLFFQKINGEKLQESLRANTRPFREDTLKMKGREVDFFRHFIQFRLMLKIFFEVSEWQIRSADN